MANNNQSTVIIKSKLLKVGYIVFSYHTLLHHPERERNFQSRMDTVWMMVPCHYLEIVQNKFSLQTEPHFTIIASKTAFTYQ